MDTVTFIAIAGLVFLFLIAVGVFSLLKKDEKRTSALDANAALDTNIDLDAFEGEGWGAFEEEFITNTPLEELVEKTLEPKKQEPKKQERKKVKAITSSTKPTSKKPKIKSKRKA